MTDRYLVLFDIDGTLLNSGGCGRAATELALADVFGTTGSLDHVNFAGKTDWQILRESLGPAGLSVEMIDARLHDHGSAVAQRLAAIVGEFPVVACPGAHAVVDALRAQPQVVLGLVTGNMETLAPIKLRAAGFDPADFAVGAFGSEGWERAMLPPLALERAVAYAQTTFHPDHTVIIGDTPGDIACAASIGARTIAVGTGPYTAEQLRRYEPDVAFESMQNHDAVVAAILNHDSPA